MWCGVACGGIGWRGVSWRGVAWRGAGGVVALCGVVLQGVVWHGHGTARDRSALCSNNCWRKTSLSLVSTAWQTLHPLDGALQLG